MKEKAYVSGKIAGLEYQEAWSNFESKELELIKQGYEVVNPMKLKPNKPIHEMQWEDYMVRDIEELFHCDAIYMMKNWGQSKGARVEYAIAREIGLKIIFES